MLLNSRIIKFAAREAGFDLCGIAGVRNFDAEREFFESWQARGYDSGLGYLRRNVEKRFSPELLVPGARSVIVCAVSYKNEISPGYGDCACPKIASYALTADYHDTIRDMLRQMAARLGEECGELGGFGALGWRAFTDSAPVLEKRWAVEAGLGFIGRNSLLVTPDYGSFVLLGELITDAEVDEYDTPFEGAGCGECRRCVDACPNSALTPAGLDTGRCISRATTSALPVEAGIAEKVGSLPLHGWMFGCDECQSACPYNRDAPLCRNPHFAPLFDPRGMTEVEWLSMTEEEFRGRFGRTPLGRTGLEQIKRALSRKR